MSRIANIVALAVFAVGASWADVKLELRGKIEPAPMAFASVTLHGSTFPFNESTLSGRGGEFKFKKLDPGTYTVIVFLPGRGEVRRTAEVSESLADKRGRVRITIPFSPSAESIEDSSSVSVRELSIPNSARKEFQQAQKSLGKRDVEAAREHLLKAVEIAPYFVGAWNNLGTMAYQSREYGQAEKYFREALKHEPGAYMPVVNLGGTLLSLDRFDEALKYNLYAVEQRPDEALPNSQLGQNYFFLGDTAKALEFLNKAKQIDPNHFSHPQFMLARVYSAVGDLEATAKELKDFIARHPDAPNAEIARRWLEQMQLPGKR